jgi:hypothetical protein
MNYPLFPHESDSFHNVFHLTEDLEHFILILTNSETKYAASSIRKRCSIFALLYFVPEAEVNEVSEY